MTLSKGPTQGLEYKLIAEKNLIRVLKSFFWVCIIMVLVVIDLLIVKNSYIQNKRLWIKATLFTLENIWKVWSVDNMKKSGLNEYLYGFSVD